MQTTETEKNLMTVYATLLPITENVLARLNELDCTKVNGEELSGIEVYTKSDVCQDGDFIWSDLVKNTPDEDVDFIRVDDYANLKFILFDFNKKQIVDYELRSDYE